MHLRERGFGRHTQESLSLNFSQVSGEEFEPLDWPPEIEHDGPPRRRCLFPGPCRPGMACLSSPESGVSVLPARDVALCHGLSASSLAVRPANDCSPNQAAPSRFADAASAAPPQSLQIFSGALMLPPRSPTRFSARNRSGANQHGTRPPRRKITRRSRNSATAAASRNRSIAALHPFVDVPLPSTPASRHGLSLFSSSFLLRSRQRFADRLTSALTSQSWWRLGLRVESLAERHFLSVEAS